MDTNAPLLDLQDVRKTFRAGGVRVTAVAGVSFMVRPGTITGLLGPDGKW